MRNNTRDGVSSRTEAYSAREGHTRRHMHLNVWLDERDSEALKALAERERMTFSEVVRRLIRDAERNAD